MIKYFVKKNYHTRVQQDNDPVRKIVFIPNSDVKAINLKHEQNAGNLIKI